MFFTIKMTPKTFFEGSATFGSTKKSEQIKKVPCKYAEDSVSKNRPKGKTSYNPKAFFAWSTTICLALTAP